MILRKIQVIDYVVSDSGQLLLELDTEERTAYFKFSADNKVIFEKPPLVEGWVKRNEAPSRAKLVLTANQYIPGIHMATDAWSAAKVRIQYELVGSPALLSIVIPVHTTTAAIDDPDTIQDGDLDALQADA